LRVGKLAPERLEAAEATLVAARSVAHETPGRVEGTPWYKDNVLVQQVSWLDIQLGRMLLKLQGASVEVFDSFAQVFSRFGAALLEARPAARAALTRHGWQPAPAPEAAVAAPALAPALFLAEAGADGVATDGWSRCRAQGFDVGSCVALPATAAAFKLKACGAVPGGLAVTLEPYFGTGAGIARLAPPPQPEAPAADEPEFAAQEQEAAEETPAACVDGPGMSWQDEAAGPEGDPVLKGTLDGDVPVVVRLPAFLRWARLQDPAALELAHAAWPAQQPHRTEDAAKAFERAAVGAASLWYVGAAANRAPADNLVRIMVKPRKCVVAQRDLPAGTLLLAPGSAQVRSRPAGGALEEPAAQLGHLSVEPPGAEHHALHAALGRESAAAFWGVQATADAAKANMVFVPVSLELGCRVVAEEPEALERALSRAGRASLARLAPEGLLRPPPPPAWPGATATEEDAQVTREAAVAQHRGAEQTRKTAELAAVKAVAARVAAVQAGGGAGPRTRAGKEAAEAAAVADQALSKLGSAFLAEAAAKAQVPEAEAAAEAPRAPREDETQRHALGLTVTVEVLQNCCDVTAGSELCYYSAARPPKKRAAEGGPIRASTVQRAATAAARAAASRTVR